MWLEEGQKRGAVSKSLAGIAGGGEGGTQPGEKYNQGDVVPTTRGKSELTTSFFHRDRPWGAGLKKNFYP